DSMKLLPIPTAATKRTLKHTNSYIKLYAKQNQKPVPESKPEPEPSRNPNIRSRLHRQR
ncbi:unnamed protein product, partial [Ceratitis capitata]